MNNNNLVTNLSDIKKEKQREANRKYRLSNPNWNKLLELGMMLRIVCNDSDNLALQRWIRGTFKRMMGLNQGVSNRICQRLMAVDLEEESKKRIERAEKRWRMRTQMREEEDEVRDRIDALSHKGNLKWVSEEMIMVANMMNHTICKRCEQNRISPKHITEAHGEICVEPDLESDLEQIMGIKTEKWRKLSGDERRIIEKVRELYKKIYDIFCKYSTNNQYDSSLKSAYELNAL